MRRLSCAFVVFVVLVNRLEGKLPDIIKPCHISDADLGKCIFESAKAAIPQIVKGVKELDIPSLAKVKLPTIKTADSESFSLILDGNLEGLETAVYPVLNYDKTKGKGQAQISLPKLKFTGKYKISGKVGDVPVTGDGDATIILDDVLYDYGYSLTKFDKDGATFFKADNPVINSFKVKQATYQLDNLSSGDKKGKEANVLLNTKNEVVKKALDPVIAEKVVQIAFGIANKFFASAPAGEVFLP